MSGLPIRSEIGGALGGATIAGPTPIVAGMQGIWTVTYHVGRDGLPQGSALALVRRWPSDWDIMQCRSPDEPGFTTIRLSTPVQYRWRTRRSIEWHPFDHVFELEFSEPIPADTCIDIRFNSRAQTFFEEASALSVRVRAGAGDWAEIGQLVTEVVGGGPDRGTLLAPSDVVAGVPFELAYRVEDQWGNPARPPKPPVIEGAVVEPLSEVPGVQRWLATIERAGVARLLAAGPLGRVVSNPIRVHDQAPDRQLRWGDIHAQCLIGCGARTIDGFFRHARDFARLDFASHQANCFLVTGDEWRETEEVTARYDEPGRFTALLGLEWSADTAKGGDRNLYFPGDSAPITRCSHEYVDDKSDLASDLPEAEDLHAKYRGTRTIVGLHVGGRTTDLSRHDPGLERLIEIHSTHATSEWFVFEALERGYRMGVTAGSDGVDGRPGASHPGHQAVRNVRGGLVAAPLRCLDRNGLWEALAARDCYATNGERILLEYSAEGHRMGSEFEATAAPTLSIGIEGTGPIESIDIFRGTSIIHSVPLRSLNPQKSDRIRIAWKGATNPGNFSRARMRWDGSVQLSSGAFLEPEGYALDTPDEGIVRAEPQRIVWRSATGGDWDGIAARVQAPDDAVLDIETAQISASIPLRVLDLGPARFADTKPLRELEVMWLPEDPGPSSWHGTYRDSAPPRGWNAYWFRVRQWNGAIAWSSPIFVNVIEGQR